MGPKELVEFAFHGIGGVLRPAQVKEEILGLMKLVKEAKPKVLIEICSPSGGSLFLLSRTAPEDAAIISIDPTGGQHGRGYSKWKIPLHRSFATPKQEIHLIRGDPHKKETLGRLRGILKGREVDFLFIDGEHSYEAAKKEFRMYSPLVGTGGMIAFNDIAGHPFKTRHGVDRFWKEIKRRHKHTEIVKDRKQEWAGIGVVFKPQGQFAQSK